MKRSLLALAVCGAFVGAASAQTNVTLYGLVDAGIGMTDTDGPGSDAIINVFTGTQAASRVGIRGSEDLGGGWRATFNIEHGMDMDTGQSSSGTQFWQRRAVVGLAAGFGEIRLGRDYTPGYLAAATTDIMGYGLFGTWLNFTTQAGAAIPIPGTGTPAAPQNVPLGGITSRASNGVHYTSPNWGGLTIRAVYATGEADDLTRPSNDGDMYGLSGVYAKGPWTVSAYYQTLDFNNGVGGTDSVDQYGVGAQYRFDMFRVAFNYGMADADNPAGGGSIEHEGWQLGGGVKLGTGEVMLSYVHQEVDVVGNPEADTWGIAYVYPLSKRTNLYATYGQTDNKNGGTFRVTAAAPTVAAGEPNATPKGFAIGIRHLF